MRTTLILATAALCAALLPASAAGAAAVPIAGTIAPGSVGACTLTLGDPLIRERCTGTETYAGDLHSTEDAVFSVSLLFNTRSGAATARGTETFTGCVDRACGMLEWSWHVNSLNDPQTLALVHGRGQVRITSGTGALAGAKGSFTIACEPDALCTYRGHLVM
jgi:hypothetical protein